MYSQDASFVRRTGVIVLVLASAVGLTASRRRPPGHRRAPEVQQLIASANRLFTIGEYSRARALYAGGFARVKPENLYDRSSFLIGIAACDQMTQQYQTALNGYEQAEGLAERGNLTEHRIIIAANRAAVYRKMGYLEPALASLESVRRPLAIHRNPLFLTQAASLLRDLDFPKSERLFRSAILNATMTGDTQSAATTWLQLGHGYLVHGQLDAADHAFTESFRLRVLSRNRQLQGCYYFLGYLRVKQRRPSEALVLLKRARELTGSEGAHIPAPWVHRQLASAYLQFGDYTRALEHFELAVQTARALRLQFLPADAFRTNAEANLQEIFDDYVSAGLDCYYRTGKSSVAKRMFEVAEESRVFVFDQSLNSSRRLPPAYWELLARYQRLLAASIGRPDASAVAGIRQIRLELSEMEARLGIETEQIDFSHQISENPLPRSPLEGVQTRLRDTEALFSFHFGARGSFLWALTRGSIEVHRLPDRKTFEAAVHDYRRALLHRDSSAPAKGAWLSRTLFGSLGREAAGKPEWLLSPDGPLFDLPIAALPATTGGDVLIGEEHSLRTVPGAGIRRPRRLWDEEQRFVGVADALYNAADPRWPDSPARGEGPELPRLPGTGREVRVCARSWAHDRNPVLLTGLAVNRERVLAELRRRPAVLHISGHVLPHARLPDQVLVALGLQQSGAVDLLTPADIVSGGISARLVTLSGCGSGTGVALPGLGLFGLSRAWLLAGADAVVATYWPIADDSGELLSVMYEELSRRPGPITASGVAASLRAAQARMRRFGGWRADPAYWAAFAVAGKD